MDHGMRFTERCFFSCCYCCCCLFCCLNVCLNSYFQQNREGVASKVHRQGTIDGLKKFNARRKLKVCQLGKYFIENREYFISHLIRTFWYEWYYGWLSLLEPLYCTRDGYIYVCGASSALFPSFCFVILNIFCGCLGGNLNYHDCKD
jgi:hypothetical protein